MKLYQLAEGFEVRGEDVEVKGITYDSRKVKEGYLFVAIKGRKHDGHKFISQALEKGASCLCVEIENNYPVPYILVKNTREILGILAARFYNHPSRRVKVIAITGTNGKTTTSFMIRDMLEAQREITGLLGTVQYCIGKNCVEADRTTPEASDIQAFLAQVEMEGGKYMVMEASSAGIEEKRLVGLEPYCAVFTNFSREHLEYHGTIENYLNAKLKLFREYKPVFSIINRDDPHAHLFMEGQKNILTFGFREDADLHAVIKDISLDGTVLDLEGIIKAKDIFLPLPGKFNVYNLMAALLVLKALDKIDMDIRNLVQKIKGVPGRFEILKGEKCGIYAIIDYAHTPEALENLLKSVNLFKKNRVILVFGAGGNRDRGKRPLFGEIAEKYSDIQIVTSDNPRDEDPEKIIDDIISGMREDRFITITDRKDAIYYAVEIAGKGDIIVIAGKGHETYQEIKGKKYPFSDREVALKAMEEQGCLS